MKKIEQKNKIKRLKFSNLFSLMMTFNPNLGDFGLQMDSFQLLAQNSIPSTARTRTVDESVHSSPNTSQTPCKATLRLSPRSGSAPKFGFQKCPKSSRKV